ncbi:MAG: insulinase family protein, partial [Bdellovibrionales bacterium]|nr:insulinase family protein [Bdellovibrionales bacterium]
MSDVVRECRLDNGITLLGFERPEVSSAAFSILVPCGAATDPADALGTSSILAEMFQKGAGPWSSRELTAELDGLGLQRSHSVGVEVSVFSGA